MKIIYLLISLFFLFTFINSIKTYYAEVYWYTNMFTINVSSHVLVGVTSRCDIMKIEKLIPSWNLPTCYMCTFYALLIYNVSSDIYIHSSISICLSKKLRVYVQDAKISGVCLRENIFHYSIRRTSTTRDMIQASSFALYVENPPILKYTRRYTWTLLCFRAWYYRIFFSMDKH